MGSDLTELTPRLLCLRGQNLAGQSFELSNTKTFGRSESCDIILLDDGQSVSRQHGRFEVAGDSVVVTDLGSTNGVFVNGERVERQQLNHGDVVKVGSQFEFQILLTDDPAAPVDAAQQGKQDPRKTGGEKPANLLTGAILPVALIALAVVGLVSSFQDKEVGGPEVVEAEPSEWKVTVPSSPGLPWQESEETPTGVTITLPFVPMQDFFLYRGERLTGKEEVFQLLYAETAGEIFIKDQTQEREKIGFFVDIARTRNESWSERELIEFDGETRWVGARPKDRTKTTDQASVEFDHVWTAPVEGGDAQTFQVVESNFIRDSAPSLTVVELYAQVPFTRIVVGGVCRANYAGLLFGTLQKVLKSIRLDPDLLRSAPSAGDAETAQYWIDEAEKGWGTLHQSPENLYRTIRAYRSAIWYLPEGFSDGTIDAAYLKNRLAESCELLDAQISEAEGRIAANRMIGRRSAVVEEVAVLIKRIPDYRDPRIYPLAGRYYEVREDFPNLTWNPRLFERIEWQ